MDDLIKIADEEGPNLFLGGDTNSSSVRALCLSFHVFHVVYVI